MQRFRLTDSNGRIIYLEFEPSRWCEPTPDPGVPVEAFCGLVKNAVKVRRNPSLTGEVLYVQQPEATKFTFDDFTIADGYQWYKYYGYEQWSASGPVSSPNQWIQSVDDCDEPSVDSPYGTFGNTWQPKGPKLYSAYLGSTPTVYVNWADAPGGGHGKAVNGLNVRRAMWMQRDPSLQHMGNAALIEWLDNAARGVQRDDGSYHVLPLYAGVLRVYISQAAFDVPTTLQAMMELQHIIAQYKDDNGNQLIRVLWVITDALGAQWPDMRIPGMDLERYFDSGFLSPAFWSDGWPIWRNFAEPVLEVIATNHPEVTFGISPFNEPTLIDRPDIRTIQNADNVTGFMHNAFDFIWDQTDGQFLITTGLGTSWHVTGNGERQLDRARLLYNHPRLHVVEDHRYLPNRTNGTNMNPTDFYEADKFAVDVQVRRELSKVGLTGEWSANNSFRDDGTRYYLWNVSRDQVEQRLYERLFIEDVQYGALQWFYSLNTHFYDHYSSFSPLEFAPGDFSGTSNKFREWSQRLYNNHV